MYYIHIDISSQWINPWFLITVGTKALRYSLGLRPHVPPLKRSPKSHDKGSRTWENGASHLGSSSPMLIPDIPCMVCYILHIWCVMVVSTDYVCVSNLGAFFFAPVQLWLEWCWILTHLHLPINGHGSTLAYQWTRYMFDAWYSIWLAGKCSLKQRFEKGSCWTKFH